MTTPLLKWLSLTGPMLYDVNEYDDILIDGMGRWGDMKHGKMNEQQIRSLYPEIMTKEMATQEKLIQRLSAHQREIDEGEILKPEDTKPAESDAEILENLERLVAALPKDTCHAAAAKNLVDYLRDNPLSGMYDPSDYESDEPVRMITEVMFLKKPPKNYPCFCFIQYDGRHEQNFRKGERHALTEEKQTNGDNK